MIFGSSSFLLEIWFILCKRFGNKQLQLIGSIKLTSFQIGLCIQVQYILSVFNYILSVFNLSSFEIFHLLGFGDCTLQPGYAGREEVFSTLRDDENTHRGRLQWGVGIKSNHAPSSLTNQWIETVKVSLLWMDETYCKAKFYHVPWRRWRASERGKGRSVRPR